MAKSSKNKKRKTDSFITKGLKHYGTGSKHVWRQFFFLLADPVFWTLTVVGNIFIGINAWVFYWLESGINPNVHAYLDALWWSFATVTTVGYGDVTPVTTWGKIHGIFLMLTGVALFMSFTALFARAILGQSFYEVDCEIKNLERDVKRLRSELDVK